MTNPTRTRAEIQAEIEKLEQELESAWPQKGAQAYCKAEVADSEDDDAEILIDGTGCFTTVPLASLIPAADLIPREEHERAVEEAKEYSADMTFDTAIDTVCRSVHDYILHTIDSQQYRVTVERVEDNKMPVDHYDDNGCYLGSDTPAPSPKIRDEARSFAAALIERAKEAGDE